MGTKEAVEIFLRDRSDKGLFQPPRLAERLGIKSSMMNMILNGKRRWSLEHLDATAAFFEMTPADLIARAQTLATTPGKETQRATGTSDAVPGKRFRKKGS
jgi:transcriptional regulator with XRE-family HTH domain